MTSLIAKISSRYRSWRDRRRAETELHRQQKALYRAVYRREHEEARQLIHLGVDPVFVLYGQSPLTAAACSGDRELVDLLMDHGASLDQPGNEYFLTGAVQMGDIELIDLALSSGMGISDEDPSGGRPLHYALKWQRLQVMDHLLSKGAQWSDLHREPRWYTTPSSVIRYLYERGYPVPEEGLHFLREETGWDPTNREGVGPV